MQAKSHVRIVPPTGKNRAVAPVRRPNAEYRKREHLTAAALVGQNPSLATVSGSGSRKTGLSDRLDSLRSILSGRLKLATRS